MSDLRGKTLFITGASRGIGKAIGLRAARDGANVVVAAKTVAPHPKLPGTIESAAEEMRAAGGRALACAVDIRFEDQIAAAMKKGAEVFGGIDILVNNAGAVRLMRTAETDLKRFDLMHQVNVRGAFASSRIALPFLRRSHNPHILNIAPPLNIEARWFAPHLAYSLSKFGMSLCTLGMAEEFKDEGIAVNALWPGKVIATAAIMTFPGGEKALARCRKPEIMADAAHAVLTRPSRGCTGHFFIDEAVLASAGVTDLDRYAVTPGTEPIPDLFVD